VNKYLHTVASVGFLFTLKFSGLTVLAVTASHLILLTKCKKFKSDLENKTLSIFHTLYFASNTYIISSFNDAVV